MSAKRFYCVLFALPLLIHATRLPANSECTQRWELRQQAESSADLQALGDIAYDLARDRIVFYGHSDFAAPSETWEFDGGQWVKRSNGGPIPVGGFGIAYDAARAATVLFGGTNLSGSTLFADTWIWDGAAWTLAMPALQPPGLAGHAMAYDALAAEVLVHGGRISSSQLSNETWGWDGLSWMLRASDGPAVMGARMVYDVDRSRMVLFGGSSSADGTQLSDAVWERPSQGAWQVAPAVEPRPAPRLFFSMAYDVRVHRTVLVGGQTQMGLTDEVWTWDGTQWAQLLPLGSPKPTPSPAMIYDPVRWVLFLHRTEMSWELREFRRGDLTCDCVVSISDIAAFVLAVTDPNAYATSFGSCNLQFADLNCDGQVSIGDAGAFVNCIVNDDCDCL